MNKTVISLFVASVVFNIFLLKCNIDAKNEININEIKYFSRLSEAEKKFKTEKNKLGNTVATQQAEIVEYSNKINELLKENTLLRAKINNQIKTTQKLEVLNKQLQASKPHIVVKDTVYYPSGTRFDLHDDCFSLKSKLINTGLLIENITAETGATVTIAADKKVSIILTNRCISVTALASIYQKSEKKWYENKWLWFGVGVVAGAGVTSAGVFLLK